MCFFVLFAILFLVRLTCDASSTNRQKMHDIFSSRSEDEWRSVWHKERHRRCFHELVSHMDWACTKDVYRLVKRNPLPKDATQTLDTNKVLETASSQDVFLKPENAMAILESALRKSHRRRPKRGIMDECCAVSGCSWEEYAEYCPVNRRVRTRSD